MYFGPDHNRFNCFVFIPAIGKNREKPNSTFWKFTEVRRFTLKYFPSENFLFSFSYKLLHVLEFDSTRKRMSVIVSESDGK